jgi:Cys-tRNA(Pro)/Cys-tRNA(Cys) deacylase
MKKPYPTWIHSTCVDFPFIFISAGVRGLQLKINPSDLLGATGASVADLIAG